MPSARRPCRAPRGAAQSGTEPHATLSPDHALLSSVPCPTLRHLSQGLSSSWAGTVSARGRGFPTHRRGFQGPFPPWRGVEWPLCSSAALITSLPAAFPSFSPLLPLIPSGALPWFCRRRFCCPRCPGRVSPHPLAGSTVQLTPPPRGTAPSAPLPCARDPSVWVQHAEAFSSGLALVCVRVCSACISLASPGFSVPQEIFFFLFATSKIPSFDFPLLKREEENQIRGKSVSSHFKTHFCHVYLISRCTSSFHTLSSE